MTPLERMYAMYQATQYLVRAGVRGDIVECRVWRGGSAMVSAMALKSMGDLTRRIFLYDTYEGMAEPSEKDVDVRNMQAHEVWAESQAGDHNEWSYAPLEDVRQNVFSTGYPEDKFVFIKGKVEETIPETIALLRLDTDWYEPTYHELVHLFPRLSPQGVLLLDDYGFWMGAREAVDTYFAQNKVKMLLTRLDGSSRLGIKSD